MALSFQELLRQLVALKPGGRPAEKLRAELTHLLMRIVRTKGLPGVRRLVKRLTSTTSLDPVFASGSVRAWRHTVADRVLVLQTITGRSMKNATLLYSQAPRTPGPKARVRQNLQDRFYARYNQVGPAGESRTTRRPSAADRLVRVIGDLEADINNGGFDQYLCNKGRPQARRAAKCLQSIGARRTGRLLQSALGLPPHSPQFERLDEAFYRSSEDLPSLVMRHLEKHGEGAAQQADAADEAL
jgi:hypothetical protein